MHSSVAVQAYVQICLESRYICLPHALLSQSACSALDDAAHSALHLLYKQQQQQQQQHASMMC
jgi:hypothetical protein